MSWTSVTDFRHPSGWADTPNRDERMRWYCEQLESGQILLFDSAPFDLPQADRQLLLSLRQTVSRHHKNISYRPNQDVLRGFSPGRREEVSRLHAIMRDYSAQVTRFLSRFLAPYAPHWRLDVASFRPLEESGRDLPLHKRNDLIHVDASVSRPTHGARILRVFTNINPTRPRVWVTTDRFVGLAQRYAGQARLFEIATPRRSRLLPLLRPVKTLARAVGLTVPERSPYDRFMLRFHHYLKENRDFQRGCPKTRLEFPPDSTWIVFTDGFPHAVLSGQFALEQTVIVPYHALLAPQESPLHLLETLCGMRLSA